MKILVLGGDGFCGWPTVLHLSNLGHNVAIVDNLSRRRIDAELATQSLTPIATLDERVNTWQAYTGKYIRVMQLDVALEFDRLCEMIAFLAPDVIVHFAEQRAAPYSMKSAAHKRYTVNNNVNATHNVLAAIVASGLNIHLVHLGTMGVYGYGTSGESLPEGYTDVLFPYADGFSVASEKIRTIRYPSNPGSIYHMTKVLDAEMFAYYAKNDRLRITDLHQGIIWGTNTTETQLHPALINRFDYDGDYGTVLNRFIVQAAIGHPLTVHGIGEQTRAFIHLQNSVQCIGLAIDHPPERSERVKIFNQMTETHRVIDLAQKVAMLTGARIQPIDNPRNEALANELAVRNDQFLDLGLRPILLDDRLIVEVFEIALRYAGRINNDRILCTSRWVNPTERAP